jgi:hypothetical protein
MRFGPLHIRSNRLFCLACGVFAALQIAGRRGDGSPIYAVTSLCDICRWNYLHAVRP